MTHYVTWYKSTMVTVLQLVVCIGNFENDLEHVSNERCGNRFLTICFVTETPQTTITNTEGSESLSKVINSITLWLYDIR